MYVPTAEKNMSEQNGNGLRYGMYERTNSTALLTSTIQTAAAYPHVDERPAITPPTPAPAPPHRADSTPPDSSRTGLDWIARRTIHPPQGTPARPAAAVLHARGIVYHCGRKSRHGPWWY